MTISVAQVMAIMFGGSIGAVMRYVISGMINSRIEANFPFGTLFVNVAGSFLMGFLAMWLVENLGQNSLLRLAIFVGFLGAFTTFSTFSMETLNLFHEGESLRALLNMLINVTFTVLAVWFGAFLGKAIS